MNDYQYDLFVIGGGSGGVRAARISAGHGARVAICEEYRYGGTCVIRGCVPKKLMVYASHYAEDFKDAVSYGWETGTPRFDWSTLIRNKDAEIDRLNGIYIKLLNDAGVAVLDGRARLIDKHTVNVAGKRYTTDKILIATGGAPFMPDIPGIEHAITSNEVFHLDKQPGDILILGGGYIAVEFAGIFNGLGTDTVLLYRGPKILRGFDEDVRSHLEAEIQKKGIKVQHNHVVTNIKLLESGRRKVTMSDDSEITVDQVMFAVGRIPNTSDLGLEGIDIALGEREEIRVDDYSRTNVDNIFAVGDVTDRIALTPVATMEGHCFADTIFGGISRSPDHDDVPSAVFSQPSVATVGLTEATARELFGNVDIYLSEFRTLKHTLTPSTERTLMKLIVDKDTDKVVGAHMVGSEAAEIIQGIAIAVKAGATKADFDATVGIHPSTAEEFVTLRTPV